MAKHKNDAWKIVHCYGTIAHESAKWELMCHCQEQLATKFNHIIFLYHFSFWLTPFSHKQMWTNFIAFTVWSSERQFKNCPFLALQFLCTCLPGLLIQWAKFVQFWCSAPQKYFERGNQQNFWAHLAFWLKLCGLALKKLWLPNIVAIVCSTPISPSTLNQQA